MSCLRSPQLKGLLIEVVVRPLHARILLRAAHLPVCSFGLGGSGIPLVLMTGPGKHAFKLKGSIIDSAVVRSNRGCITSDAFSQNHGSATRRLVTTLLRFVRCCKPQNTKYHCDDLRCLLMGCRYAALFGQPPVRTIHLKPKLLQRSATPAHGNQQFWRPSQGRKWKWRPCRCRRFR